MVVQAARRDSRGWVDWVAVEEGEGEEDGDWRNASGRPGAAGAEVVRLVLVVEVG